MKCAPNYIYFTRDPKSSHPNHNLKVIQKFGEKELNFHHTIMTLTKSYQLCNHLLDVIRPSSSHLIPNFRVSPLLKPHQIFFRNEPFILKVAQTEKLYNFYGYKCVVLA